MNEQLLIRFLTHHCTPEEMAQVEQWATLDPANATWLFEIERVWSLRNELQFAQKERIEAAYRRFIASRSDASSVSPGPTFPFEASEEQSANVSASVTPKIRYFLRWFRYAAAVLLIALLSLNLYQMRRDVPAGINIVEVPAGEKASLTLSDGSRVWLNAGSRFTYPAAFSPTHRQVELVGEGFFEVTPNPRSPFRVQTPAIQIKVLGTKFNLKAYRNEISRVTLTEGAVEVTAGRGEKLTLQPHQQACYSLQNGLTLLTGVDPDLASGWRDGELVFTRECLTDIVRELQRKFNVCIRIDDPSLGAQRFNCRVAPGASALQVLDLLKKTREFDYRIQQDTIQILKNKLPMGKQIGK